MTKFTSKKIEELIEAKLSHNFGVTSSVASNDIFYKACVLVIKDIMKKQREERAGGKAGILLVYGIPYGTLV